MFWIVALLEPLVKSIMKCVHPLYSIGERSSGEIED